MTDDPKILGVSSGRTYLSPDSPTDRAFVDSWRHRDDAHAQRGDVVLLTGWLLRIHYKPDTRFEIMPELTAYGGLQIRVTRFLADSTKGLSTFSEFIDPSNHIEAQAVFEVPPYYLRTHDFDAFWHWIHHEIFGMEKHEMNEWFRVDNNLPFDPHKEK